MIAYQPLHTVHVPTRRMFSAVRTSASSCGGVNPDEKQLQLFDQHVTNVERIRTVRVFSTELEVNSCVHVMLYYYVEVFGICWWFVCW